MGRILAIDYGRKRTGLAVTDVLRITANPLLTIETNQLMAWLADYFSKVLIILKAQLYFYKDLVLKKHCNILLK